MKTCLVKKLKAAADNNNLPLFGKVKFTVHHVDSPSSTTQRLILRDDYGSEAFTCKIIGNGYFMTGSYGGTNVGKEYTINSTTWQLFCSNPAEGETYDVIVDNVYNIQLIRGVMCYASFEQLQDSDIVTYKIESDLLAPNISNDIKYTKNWTNLTEFNSPNVQNIFGDISIFANKIHLTKLELFGTQVYGDVEALRPLNLLTYLGIRYSPIDKAKFYGNIRQAFGLMTSLSTLYVFQNTGLSGSIERMVNAWVTNGKTSGNISSRTYSTSESNVTFNDSPLPSSGNATIVWAPNTDPTKTDITVNGTTVTIDN